MSENRRDMGDPTGTEELDALLGAYALDAVDETERRRVEDYLRINPKAAAEVRAHREVASMLAFTGADAPDGVWAKIADVIDADAPAPSGELAEVFALDPATRRTSAPEVPPIAATGSTERTRRGNTGWWFGAAAAVLLAVAGFVVVNSSTDSGSNDPIAAAFERATDGRGSVQGDLVAENIDETAFGVIDRDGHGYLDASNLPRLDSDQTYQLWGVLADNGDVVSLGILGGDPELETFTVVGEVDALAITIEAAPGVISDGNPDGAYVGALS